jgi:ABC-type amino acid transport system permease subunit
MASDKVPGSQTASLTLDAAARRRGRMGLAVPWENIPWWGIIILIVGVIVGYSVFTSTRYLDALYFIFDLPWNKQGLVKLEKDKKDIGANGEWSATVTPALKPGRYTLYAEYLNQEGETLGRSDVYRIEVPEGVTEATAGPLTSSGDTYTQIQTSTPTIAGVAPAGTATVLLYDDFSNNLGRILARIWNANGVFLTIRVTIIAFASALVLGLMFGLMRVSSRSPNLIVKAGRRLLVGLGLIALIWAAVPAWRSPTSIVLVALVVEAIMFLSPAMPYTLSTLYVEVVRGVPMLVIILYMGFAVTPALRNASQDWVVGELDLRGLPAAIIGLAFGYGAYLAEVYRAGIESIPKGQMEAARSLGMSYFHAMRYVILPQAIRVVLPPLGNDFIAMLKDTSLISVIALPEVLQQGRLWISRNFRAFEGFNSVAMLYLVMTLFLSLLVRFIERKSALPGR